MLEGLLSSNKFKIITNKERDADGGEQAGELFCNWIKAKGSPWKKVGVLLYCEQLSGVRQLHQPKKGVFVSTKSTQLLQFAQLLEKSGDKKLMAALKVPL